MSKDYYKNERIELAREKVKNAETLEDIALVVTREGLDLLSTTLENSMRRIIQEEIQKATKELALGFLKGMEPVKQLPEPKEEPRINPEEYSWNEEDWNKFYENPIEKLSNFIPQESLLPKRNYNWTEEEDRTLLENIFKLMYPEGNQYAPSMSEQEAVNRVEHDGRQRNTIVKRFYKLKKRDLYQSIFKFETEEEPEGRPMFNLWEHQAQLAEERKKRIGKRGTRYSLEETESIKQQFKELKKKFPDKTDNWIVERITLPGRTNKAIANLFHRKIKGEINL